MMRPAAAPMRVPHFLKPCARRSLLLALGAAMLACAFWNGPLAEGASSECLFAASVLGGMVLLAITVSGRIAFGLIAGSLPMLLLEIAANLKFKYLATPLLAPDLIYYFNRQILDTLLNYPFLIGAIVLALVLAPLILVVTWRGDRKPSRGWRVRVARGAGAIAGIRSEERR